MSESKSNLLPFTKNYASFIKAGKRKHIEQLFEKGLLFCNTIEYFRKLESKDLQGDPHDGAAYIEQVKDLRFFIGDKEIAKSERGQLYRWHPDDVGNAFCVYGIETNTLKLDNKSRQNFKVEFDNLVFADTALLIYDPGEFVKRVESKLRKKGYNPKTSPINYYDHRTYEGELTPLMKSNKYKGQNEVRMWIPNKKNDVLKVKIGSIKDISYMIPISDFDNLTYTSEL